MRLHRLSLGALGPFAAAYDLDLDAVTAGGLFLLEGPTGAGKTTVLDAVTFALYGTVSGIATSKDRLRTDFSPAGDSFAELEFSIGGRRHVVRRTPAYERAKQRGEGTTTVPASVRLWRVDAQGARTLLSQRVREADDEILRLLGGLSAEQFRQVVVLPQGEFATFLRAAPDDRRAVLQRLFGTEHYLAVEQVLAGLRREADTAVGGAELAVRDALVGVLEAADVAGAHPDADADGEAASQVDVLLALDRRARRDQLDVLELQVAERVDTGAAALADVRAEHERARTEVEELTRVSRLVLRRRAALAARSELDSAVPSVERARDVLAAATRAADLAPLLDAVDRARVEHEDAVRALGSLGVPGAGHAARADADADGLARAAERLRREADRLAPAVDLERAAAQRAGEMRDLMAERSLVAAGLVEARTRLRILPRELAERRAALADRDREAARSVALLEAQAAVVDRCTAWDALPAARRAVADAEDAVRVATDEAQRARGAGLDARERRIEGMAAELASRLVEGEPCPVCGGLDHPAPAQGPLDHPTAEAVAELDRLARAAEDVRTAAEGRRQAALTDLASWEALAGPEDPHPALELLRGEIERAAEAAVAAERLRTEVREAEAEAGALQARVEELRSRDAVLGEQVARAQEQVASDEAVVVAARGGAASVASRRDALLAQEAALREQVLARRTVERAAEQLAAVERTAVAAARSAGFADLDALRSAVTAPDDLARIRDLVRDHDETAAAVARELADPEVATAGEDLPDLAGSESRLASVQARLEAAHQAVGVAAERLSVVRSRRVSLEQVEDATEQVRAEVRATIRVADAAAGRPSVNPRRMTLSTYVLRERFESVVGAASQRLQAMSDGRYLLVSDERGTGNRKAGLGLAVVDQWTGQQRDTATLSGGESFYASLALALGLADTVRDEVGGVELETLFIDEGFGSLDADALEQVLDVIDGLRDGGRVVGIVSHVTELKERIADRIEVRRLTDGSSALAVRV